MAGHCALVWGSADSNDTIAHQDIRQDLASRASSSSYKDFVEANKLVIEKHVPSATEKEIALETGKILKAEGKNNPTIQEVKAAALQAEQKLKVHVAFDPTSVVISICVVGALGYCYHALSQHPAVKSAISKLPELYEESGPGSNQ